MISTRQVIISFYSAIFFWTASCNNTKKDYLSNADNSKISECDTMIEFALSLIEKHDSVFIDGNKKKLRSFKYTEIDEDGVLQRFNYPFYNVFHDSIDFVSIEEIYGEIFFSEEVTFNYSSVREYNLSCQNKYYFIDSDSVDGIKKYFHEVEIPEKFPIYYSLSYPIISIDGRFLIVEMDKHSFWLSGEGLTFVFKRINTLEWKLDRTIVRWIS